MRIFVVFLAIILSINTAFAKKSKVNQYIPSEAQFEIDEEFQTDFVGYDEKEFKAYKKEQKAKAKLEKKHAKLNAKKIKLETKKNKKIENSEYCQKYIERLEATRVEPRDTDEDL